MSLWKSTDAAASAPQSAPAGGLGVSANGFTLFANTTADVFKTGLTLGVFGVDAAEQTATTAKGGHAGWVLRKTGSGGRAGRVQVETLVAMGSISTDAEDTTYPDYRIVISSQPQATSNVSGGSASFSVTAATLPAGGELSYQWSVYEDGGAATELSGETAATLDLTDIATDNVYFVVVSTTGGATDATSANAALTITA